MLADLLVAIACTILLAGGGEMARPGVASAAVVEGAASDSLGVLASPDSVHAAAAVDSLAANATTDSASVPQRDVMDVVAAILGREHAKEPKLTVEARTGLSITLLPSLGYNPSYGAFAGVSATAAGRLGPAETTNISSASAGASYSTTHQISVQLKSDFFVPGNGWNLRGDWRYLDTSQDTYGLGPLDPSVSPYPMKFVLYRLHQAAYRKLGRGPFFLGLGYQFDRYDNIRDVRAAAGETTPFTSYSGGAPKHTQSSAFSLSVVTDRRDNPVNAHRGIFWNATVRPSLRVLGSDSDWQSVWSDFRAYLPLRHGSRSTLALWNTVWLSYGHSPYLELPAIGWDTYGRTGRGFLQGRLRATKQLYQEIEYRMNFTRSGLFGGVVFLNLTASASHPDGGFHAVDPGYGVGGRMKFNKITDVNLAVDAARGQDGRTRYFFGLQEVF